MRPTTVELTENCGKGVQIPVPEFPNTRSLGKDPESVPEPFQESVQEPCLYLYVMKRSPRKRRKEAAL